MKQRKILIGGIPAIIWGEPSDKAYIFVHGKMSAKEYAADFARVADENGFQTISFDLPQHGERKIEERPCDYQNGIADLDVIGDFVYANWKEVALFACSLGAFLSLHAYRDRKLTNCLFESPLVNMGALIGRMFLWFNVTEEELKAKGVIDTPVDRMSWDYYTYVKENPVTEWNVPTHILYAARDQLQSLDDINGFASRFGADVTVSENSDHPFMEPGDAEIVEKWIRKSI